MESRRAGDAPRPATLPDLPRSTKVSGESWSLAAAEGAEAGGERQRRYTSTTQAGLPDSICSVAAPGTPVSGSSGSTDTVPDSWFAT
ncbi:hypothetical protein AS850_13875 [Frondihabitans sp. 762G35]|nr:hypothetical protein AS850_13875 [Frondihabitans sp. 762G35]